MLAFTVDPNARITEQAGAGRFDFTYHTPLLAYALAVRNHDIALAPANDPRTDIRAATGYSPTGMNEVLAVLAKRTSELMRQEAVKWDRRAATLAP